MSAKMGYWADNIAVQAIKNRGLKQVVATGITPSGPIHLGNLREVVTADASFRALKKGGAEASLIYIADTFDPLRRVYPFLPSSYEKYVGRPLYRIPDPDGCCESYAEHFLKPFLNALGSLGVTPTIYRAHELYREGVYTEVISEALSNRDKIASILKEKTGRDISKDWVPFNVECQVCESITDTKIFGADVSSHTVDYTCECGHKGVADYGKGMGKLPWRIDWPARWKTLEVTVEPFGKDHATAGGSYDTGSEISREVFGYEPPSPIVYEWIYLKGKGAMASSTGVAISIQEVLDIVPPGVVRFLILRVRPEKHIEFDPVSGLLQLVDEYQGVERSYFAGELPEDSYLRRVYELSRVGAVAKEAPPQIPFLHLVLTAQMVGSDVRRATEVLGRSGYIVEDTGWLSRRLGYARNWLTGYAPDVFKFTVREELPAEVVQLSGEQKRLLVILAERFKDCEWRAEGVHNLIHEHGKRLGLSPAQSFQAIYLALLGKKSGPRAGWFITSLDRAFVVQRFLEASV